MKVMGIKDIDKFFEVVDSCKGKVELVTGEGPELEIVAYEKEDIDKLMDYMISRNN